MGQQISTTISDSRKALLVLLCKLECFAVCWGFKLCLAIIYKLKVGKRGENFGNIASISQTHLFHKFYIHISLSTHTSGGIAKPVAFYWFVTIVWSFKLHFWKCFKTKKAEKMAKIWKNRASLSSHNISQNLHRYFTLYGISCWWATCSWVGASLSSFMPFINSFGSI